MTTLFGPKRTTATMMNADICVAERQQGSTGRRRTDSTNRRTQQVTTPPPSFTSDMGAQTGDNGTPQKKINVPLYVQGHQDLAKFR